MHMEPTPHLLSPPEVAVRDGRSEWEEVAPTDVLMRALHLA